MGDDKDARVRIDGKGFSQEDFSPDERAEHRHMKYLFTREFLSHDEFLEKTGLEPLVKLAKAAPVFIKLTAGWMALAGFVAYLYQAGFFP